jgi:hypothetical protein
MDNFYTYISDTVTTIKQNYEAVVVMTVKITVFLEVMTSRLLHLH